MADDNRVELATELTVAWLANPHTRVAADDVQLFLASMHSALGGLEAPTPAAQPVAEHTPAVSVRRSLASPDKIISMIDGKPYSTLARHLKQHGLTPNEYRARYGLKADYPMIAPSYSEKRSSIAKTLGLGRKTVEKAATTGVKKATRGIAAAKQAAKEHLGIGADENGSAAPEA